MNLFERYLTVWVGLCIIIGVLLGQFLPGVFQAIAGLEIAKVNIPVGVLVWVMIIPMLLKIDFGALHQVRAHSRGTVSYTHLRAHETVLDLVCRLLLDK